jgi:hypothetical protein
MLGADSSVHEGKYYKSYNIGHEYKKRKGVCVDGGAFLNHNTIPYF